MTTSNKTSSLAPRGRLARRGRRASVVMLASLLFALPATSFAQAPPAAAQPSQPSPADLESARELFKEGREARQSGDLRRALERFKAAHAYGQTPVTGLELGRTHMQLGELVEAREVLLSVARMKVQSDEGEKSVAARTEASDLAEDVKKRVPTLAVKLSGAGPDAPQVTVDGFAVPVVGLTSIRKANPGKHVVVARVGTREETRNVELEEGKTQDLAIDFGGAPGAGSSTAVLPPKPEGGRVISPVVWVGLGVGVVGIAVGSVGGVLALGKASKVKDACTDTRCPPSAEDNVTSGRTSATISTIGFAVGGAGLAAAAVGYFFLSKPRASSGLTVAPFLTAGGAGLDGSF
jgi:hypothetical protein